MRRAETPLTPRQHEILGLMAEGLSNGGIARRLHLTEKTVVRHCSNIYAALGLEPSSEAHRRVLAVVRHLRVAHHEARPAEREDQALLRSCGPAAELAA